VPYRVDIANAPPDAFDRLVGLGAIDIESAPGELAVLMPDGITPEAIAAALGVSDLRVSPVTPRDDGSLWILDPRPVHAGGLEIAPAGVPANAGALRLIDSPVFGSGLHPTTALCLDALNRELRVECPPRLLDVGTGSGILALAALMHGVDSATAIDNDPGALHVARANAELNGLAARVHFVCGGPEAVGGRWPLVIANILAAPLIELAPELVRLMAHGGRLVLSGVPEGVAAEVARAYRNLGMRHVQADVRAGWSCMLFNTTW
jgi:ribosomal protein L11 methyltransferase